MQCGPCSLPPCAARTERGLSLPCLILTAALFGRFYFLLTDEEVKSQGLKFDALSKVKQDLNPRLGVKLGAPIGSRRSCGRSLSAQGPTPSCLLPPVAPISCCVQRTFTPLDCPSLRLAWAASLSVTLRTA